MRFLCQFFSLDSSFCVRTEARQRVGSATHCHLDKTNMDKTSMHDLKQVRVSIFWYI